MPRGLLDWNHEAITERSGAGGTEILLVGILFVFNESHANAPPPLFLGALFALIPKASFPFWSVRVTSGGCLSRDLGGRLRPFKESGWPGGGGVLPSVTTSCIVIACARSTSGHPGRATRRTSFRMNQLVFLPWEPLCHPPLPPTPHPGCPQPKPCPPKVRSACASYPLALVG